MSDKFDDLFNEFLGDDLNKSNDNSKPTNLNDIDDTINNLIKKMVNDVGDDLDISKYVNNNLGEPSEVRYYEEDGLYFTETTWETEIGLVKKTIVSDLPLDGYEKNSTKIELSLEEQLEEALENEEYEKAAKLRDSIKKQKKSKKKL